MVGKSLIVIGGGGSNGGVLRLESLKKNVGVCDMATADTANDLREEVKSALLCSVVWETESGICLHDADGSKFW